MQSKSDTVIERNSLRASAGKSLSSGAIVMSALDANVDGSEWPALRDKDACRTSAARRVVQKVRARIARGMRD